MLDFFLYFEDILRICQGTLKGNINIHAGLGHSFKPESLISYFTFVFFATVEMPIPAQL